MSIFQISLQIVKHLRRVREKAACQRREVAEGEVRNPRQVSERLKGL